MAFSRQEYWSELPCPFPRDLPNLRNQTQVFLIAGRFCLSHQGSPSSTTRVQTQVPYTGRWVLYLWPTSEVPVRTFLCMCTNTRTESLHYSNLIIQISLCCKFPFTDKETDVEGLSGLSKTTKLINGRVRMRIYASQLQILHFLNI